LDAKDQRAAVAQDDERALIVDLTDAPGGAEASGSSGVRDSAEAAPSTGVRDSGDITFDSGVRDSAEEAARLGKERHLVQIAAAAAMRDAELITNRLREQQHAAEERANADVPDWGLPEAPNHDVGAACDQLRMQLEGRELTKRVMATPINVGTTFSVCDNPNGEGCVILKSHLCDACVIDVLTRRAVVKQAFEETQRFDNAPMPPRCHLIRQLHGFANARNPELLKRKRLR
jgi:hypothetical protein